MSLLPCIVWLGLLLLQDHEDPVRLLFTLYSPLPQPPYVADQSPWHCTFLGEAMEETGVTSSLWAVAADLLGPPLLIQNLLIPVGRVKCLMVLGFLWRKKKGNELLRIPRSTTFYQSLTGTGGPSVAFWQRGLRWAGGFLREETPLAGQA